jgi:hypothetical protein
MAEDPWSPEICPCCEEGILATRQICQDINFEGSLIRIPGVQVEECRLCGFHSVSGRDAGLFELLFTPEFGQVKDLVCALKTAGYCGMFLKEDQKESSLAFGSQTYITELADDLKPFYMDNESNHVIEQLTTVSCCTMPLELNNRPYNVRLPKMGEGENGVVYEYTEDVGSVLKIAKPRSYSRDHLKMEHEVTRLFESRGIPIPRIVDADPLGRFMIKEKLEGESLAKIYDRLGPPRDPRHRTVFCTVQRFVHQLLEFFIDVPEAKTSISPNNIFVVLSGDSCRCLLVDTGPAPCHDYSRFDFNNYWNCVIPDKIRRYKEVGYL